MSTPPTLVDKKTLLRQNKTSDIKINYESIYFGEKIDLTNLDKLEKTLDEINNDVVYYYNGISNEKAKLENRNKKFEALKDNIEELHKAMKEEIRDYLHKQSKALAKKQGEPYFFKRAMYYMALKKTFKDKLAKATTYEESKQVFNDKISQLFGRSQEEIKAFGDKKVCIGFNGKHLDDENIEKLFTAIDFFKSKGYNVIVSVCSDVSYVNEKIPYYYNSSEFERLDEINNMLVARYGQECQLRYSEDLQVGRDEVGIRKVVSGYFNKWTHSQVKNANSKIDNLVEIIKKNNFSPFETMIF